ncbi:MAG TPA: hypothetical protein VI072_17950 [Polyangiaceae bacterium]
MGWSRPIDPTLATINPDGYRARVALCDDDQLLQHLRSLSPEQLRQHLHAVLPRAALQSGAGVHVQVQFTGDGLSASFRFGDLTGAGSVGSVAYRDRFPSAVHDAMIWAAREFANEARLTRLEFAIRFELASFSIAPLERSMEFTRGLVAGKLVPRRYVAVHYPQQRDRGTVDPPYVALFADLTTDLEEAVCVELCRTEHPGHQEALIAWAEQRAREASVSLEHHRY